MSNVYLTAYISRWVGQRAYLLQQFQALQMATVAKLYNHVENEIWAGIDKLIEKPWKNLRNTGNLLLSWSKSAMQKSSFPQNSKQQIFHL